MLSASILNLNTSAIQQAPGTTTLVLKQNILAHKYSNGHKKVTSFRNYFVHCVMLDSMQLQRCTISKLVSEICLALVLTL